MAKNNSDMDIEVLIFIIAVLITLIGAYIAAVCGFLKGGTIAIANYGKSFKENLFDSNRAVSIYCIIVFISLSIWLYNYVFNLCLGLPIK